MTERILTDSNGRKHITNEPQLHPPPRQWVGLTEEDWKHLYDEFAMGQELDEFAEAIEAKLKEKNSGQAQETIPSTDH